MAMNTLAADVRPAKIDGAHPNKPSSSDLLEQAAEQLEGLSGSLGVLAAYLDGLENVGTDTALAVYAAGHAVEHIRRVIATSIEQVMLLEQAAR